MVGLATVVSAQTNVEVSQGVQFDFVNPGARSLAMGGAFVSAADDATAALTNPAGLRALSKSEISFEARNAEQIAPYVFGGRLTGTLTNRGLDTTNGPIFQESSFSEFRPAFLSAVWAGADRRWTIAGFRHETSRATREIKTQGAFFLDQFPGQGLPPADTRYRPVIGNLALEIVGYGAAASFKFQSCDSVGSLKNCEDRFAVGGGVTYYTFSLSSLTTRYSSNASPGDVSAPTGAPQYTTAANYQTEDGEGSAVAPTIGVMFIPHRRFQIGASYRMGVQFDYFAQSYRSSDNVGVNQDTAATFNVPDKLAVGLTTRLGASTLISAELTHVAYSQLMDGFLSLFQGTAAAEDTEPVRYHAENKRQFHIGMEHQFLGSAIAPALRVGAWYDPDHAIYNDLAQSTFQPDKDVWHITFGGGVLLKALEVSAGFDMSDRGNVFSTSAVIRF